MKTTFGSRLLSSFIVSLFIFAFLAGPVKADALLGVIGFHIVPMQLENSQETQEEESSADEVEDSGETTVADIYSRKRYIDVRAVAYNEDEIPSSLEM